MPKVSKRSGTCSPLEFRRRICTLRGLLALRSGMAISPRIIATFTHLKHTTRATGNVSVLSPSYSLYVNCGELCTLFIQAKATPFLTATISAMMLRAISSGVLEPIAKPIGVCKRASCLSEIPFSLRRLIRS